MSILTLQRPMCSDFVEHTVPQNDVSLYQSVRPEPYCGAVDTGLTVCFVSESSCWAAITNPLNTLPSKTMLKLFLL